MVETFVRHSENICKAERKEKMGRKRRKARKEISKVLCLLTIYSVWIPYLFY
jgi:hypothetical protein